MSYEFWEIGQILHFHSAGCVEADWSSDASPGKQHFSIHRNFLFSNSSSSQKRLPVIVPPCGSVSSVLEHFLPSKVDITLKLDHLSGRSGGILFLFPMLMQDVTGNNERRVEMTQFRNAV